jgi:hypothetical protein
VEGSGGLWRVVEGMIPTLSRRFFGVVPVAYPFTLSIPSIPSILFKIKNKEEGEREVIRTIRTKDEIATQRN